MKVSVVSGKDLKGKYITRWNEIQKNYIEFGSPYFRPEFTQAVASVRNDVYIGIIEDGGEIAGFFPFQKNKFGIAKPVGGALSDFQAIIMEKDLAINPTSLLKDCGLSIWDYDHLLVSQKAFDPYHSNTADSPYIELNDGYEEYCDRLISRGSTLIKKIERQKRVLERDIGRVETQFEIKDRNYLQELIKWRIARYRKQNYWDAFTCQWSKMLLLKILDTHSDAFSGILSGLFVNDKPVALHMGMRSATVWHYWFPAFDNTLAKYSPGQILLLEMAKYAPSAGLTKIDMGKGDEDYKVRFMTGSTTNASGSITRLSIPTALRNIVNEIERVAKLPVFYPITRTPGRYMNILKRNRRYK